MSLQLAGAGGALGGRAPCSGSCGQANAGTARPSLWASPPMGILPWRFSGQCLPPGAFLLLQAAQAAPASTAVPLQGTDGLFRLCCSDLAGSENET